MLVYRKLYHYIVRVSMLLSVHIVNGHSAQGCVGLEQVSVLYNLWIYYVYVGVHNSLTLTYMEAILLCSVRYTCSST
jgi:hypothetical protein